MLIENPSNTKDEMSDSETPMNIEAGRFGQGGKKLDEVIVPKKGEERSLRDAMGKFATGVTIVTVKTENGPVGMTVNSFASVSLDPALVLWSIEKKSGRYSAFTEAEHFGIHVLDESQADLALEFARNANAFDNCAWHTNEMGVPMVEGVLSRFECKRAALHEGGDHTIIVGEVLQYGFRYGEPLVFASGKFGVFGGMGTKD
ncbi:MAG: flavin reductase family protein [Salaquimonas sp.]